MNKQNRTVPKENYIYYNRADAPGDKLHAINPVNLVPKKLS